jgi:anthranilate phosphoribosyltransferase
VSVAAIRARLQDERPLLDDDADALLDALVGDAPDADRRDLLLAMGPRALAGAELAALAMALRRRAHPVSAPAHAVDTAGTGGDASHSVNLSTAAALVVAAAGVPVVKHGNRAISGRCGSADVVEALGVPIAATPAQAERQLERTGFTFLFAPAFHPTLAVLGPLRRSLAVRTAFNVLGPLINPARPGAQLVGAWSPEVAASMADALLHLPVRAAAVVHGAPAWDEATPCGPFHRWTVADGEVAHREIDPRFTYGVRPCAPEALAGGDASDNASLLQSVFSGVPGAIRDAVALNAALLLEVVGAAPTPAAAWERANQTIDSGAVSWLIDRLHAAG